jgi:predicted dehydrogenase
MKVGIVGLQRGHSLVNALATHPRLEISAVCDIDAKVLAETGDSFGLDAARRFSDFDGLAASDVDIIAIATPIGFHAEQSIKALDSGKHVLCEQTQAYTIAECQAIIDAQKRSTRVYMMAENYTYFHYMSEWRRKIDNGDLGHIFYAEAEYLHDIVSLMVDPATGERRWRYTRPPIHYCAHTLGPLLTLMKDRVVRATGVHSGKSRFPDEEGEGFLDMEVALFQTEKGRVIKVLRSQAAPRHPDLVWYCLHGTNGFIENGRTASYGNASKGLFFSNRTMAEKPGAEEIVCDTANPDAPAGARVGAHGTSEYYLVRDFVEAIETGRPAPIDAVRASEFTVPGIIAHESAKQGGIWLDVPRLS